MTPEFRQRLLACGGVALLALFSTCSQEAGAEREISQVREFVPVPRPEMRARDSYDRFGYQRPVTSRYVWNTPTGWQPAAPTEMRAVNFVVAGEPEAECYFSELRGGGGRTAENVNRWRRQIGLDPLSEVQIAALPRQELLGVPGIYVELAGAYAGMGGEARPAYKLVGILVELAGGDAAAMKMVGPAVILDRERDNFVRLCASFRVRDDPEAARPTPTAARSPGAAPGGGTVPAARSGSLVGLDLTWEPPSGWVAGRASSMRAGSFGIGPAAAGAECAVFVFRRPEGGDELSNIQRWYGQIGQELPPEGLMALEQVQILGGTSRLVDLRGSYADMTGQAEEGQGMLAVFSELPTHVVCIKATGPTSVIEAERQHFLEFCRSIRVEQ